jgi:two-component system chemotaxis response regulator CheY
MTLLIAEDSEKIRVILRNIVGMLFEEIYECSNGQEACDLYSEKKPDYVLMDIQMPVMDGLTATRKIMEFDPYAKVIIVTNYDSNVLRKNAKQAGALGYIMKENLSELNELLN